MDNLDEIGVAVAKASAAAVDEFRTRLLYSKQSRTPEEISVLEQIFLSGLSTGPIVVSQGDRENEKA